MSALHIKLFREMRRLWAQVLAIALVMAAGVATLLIGVGTYQSLDQTRNAYYQANRFADVFATVTRAPRSVLQDIADIDGVLAVDGRISKIALADIEGVEEPASVLLVSLAEDGAQGLNRLYLRSGRLPEPSGATEAVVSEIFAEANGFRAGSQLKVVMNGAQRQLTLVGVALSPDYVYAVAPGEIMPNEGRFGVVWVPESVLAGAYDLSGAFNAVSVRLLPGASEREVIARLDRLLAPFGGQGAYGRAQQTSHAYLDSELMQLQSMSRVLPPVFLLVAAFLVNMTLTRLIALEREQIGLLKAIGYSAWSIGWHYVEFVLLIAVLGIAIGLALGTWAGGALTELYARFYSFPVLVFSREPSLYLIAGGTTMAAAVLGALRAVRAAARLPPAVAMSPPAPPAYRNLLAGRFGLVIELRKTWVMVSRHLLHWPWRTAGGVIGLALSVAVLVGSLWSVGGVDYMIDYTFNRTERQDATINFLGTRPPSAAQAVERLPGVLAAEPFRALGVEIGSGHVTRRIAIIGRPAAASLTRLLDTNLTRVGIPESGLLLTRSLADILRVGPGDIVNIRPLEGTRQSRPVHVSALVEGYLGLGAYMELGALQDLVAEGDQISGVNISVDTLMQDALFARLKQTPSLGQISMQTVALQQFRATMAQNLYVMIGVLVGLAGIIAFGVVYNFSRISLSEQGREMASLRVLGFTRAEVSTLLLAEIAVLTLLAQPLGWALGFLVAFGMVEGFSSEIFTMPFVIGPEVFAYSSLVVMTAALVSGLIVRRRIDRLDMIAVLKTRE
jgi:putative ABC transport system permease protein